MQSAYSTQNTSDKLENNWNSIECFLDNYISIDNNPDSLIVTKLIILNNSVVDLEIPPIIPNFLDKFLYQVAPMNNIKLKGVVK